MFAGLRFFRRTRQKSRRPRKARGLRYLTCLVTLSACDTANGKLEGEEGIDGLAEAFLLAGPKSVAGALWEVDDSATRSLMESFYSHLAQGQDKTSALRQAKLDYLRTSANSSPALWAPFTLIGDGSTPVIF